MADARVRGADHRIPDRVFETLSLVFPESLLAEAEIPTAGGPRSAFELITGKGGPPLGVEEREVLEQLATRPLGLYRVLRVDPGRGFTVADEPSGETTAVEDRNSSQQLHPGDVLVARLLHRRHAVSLSAFVLPFPRDELQRLREGLRELEKRVRRQPPDRQRRELGAWLVDAWLEMAVRRSRPPELSDAATGERIVLTSDHYRVHDWAALEARLAAEPDVDGSRAAGAWTRVERSGRTSRGLYALNVGKGERLEVFAQTLGRADESREWLRRVAGDLVDFRAREVVDPTEAVQNPERDPVERPPAATVPSELHQAVIEQTYADWARQPIPALDGKTPRQAVRSKLGRERVVELLLSYEHFDRNQARDEGREPVDFGFLWRSVGLERPADG